MESSVNALDILGSKWDVEVRTYDEDPVFKESCMSGYCQARIRRIVLCNMRTHPEWKTSPIEVIQQYMKEVTRHEILHAFLYESGLDGDSSDIAGGWALNEEMVDWFALQGPKIFKVWQECHAI